MQQERKSMVASNDSLKNRLLLAKEEQDQNSQCKRVFPKPRSLRSWFQTTSQVSAPHTLISVSLGCCFITSCPIKLVITHCKAHREVKREKEPYKHTWHTCFHANLFSLEAPTLISSFSPPTSLSFSAPPRKNHNLEDEVPKRNLAETW